jgi:hypothetical protein
MAGMWRVKAAGADTENSENRFIFMWLREFMSARENETHYQNVYFVIV